MFEAVCWSGTRTLPLEPFERYIDRRRDDRGSPPEPESAASTLPQPSAAMPTLKQATERLVREALRRSGGNQKAAALRQAVSKRLKRLSS